MAEMARHGFVRKPRFNKDDVRRIYDDLGSGHALFALPTTLIGLRRKAARLFSEGDHVVEFGCGTGSNAPAILKVVGSSGHYYGVDSSSVMLTGARDRVLRNASFVHEDAARFEPYQLVDGVLFGLSYNTMPDHRAILAHAWDMLRPGGRLVIMDAALPSSRLLKPLEPWFERFAQRLGADPTIKPWEELAKFAKPNLRWYLFRYYLCWADKPQE